MRGKDVVMIFREPMTLLNRVLTIGGRLPVSRVDQAGSLPSPPKGVGLARIAEPEQHAAALACNPKGADRRRAMSIACAPTQRRSAPEDAGVIVRSGTPE